MSINFALALGLLNMSSMRAGRVTLTLSALQLGAQPVTVGLLAATFSVFPAVLSWPAGKLADRFGSRWLLMVGALGGGLGILIPYFFSGMTAIFVAAATNGLSLSIYNVSLQNAVGLLSTPENRTQSFSNYSLTNSLGSLAGPLIAGFSIEHLGYSASCLHSRCWRSCRLPCCACGAIRCPAERARSGRQAAVSAICSPPRA